MPLLQIYHIGFTADLYHITIDNINGGEVTHLPYRITDFSVKCKKSAYFLIEGTIIIIIINQKSLQPFG
jgi:hypothetical protein